MSDDIRISDRIKRIKELVLKGNKLLEQQKYDQALSTFDEVITEEPRFFDAIIGKMKVYRELYQWENVIKCCDKILEINPNEITAIEHKIWSLYALDKIDEALNLAKKAQRTYPDNYTIQQCIDASLEKKQKIEKPVIAKERIIKKPIAERKIEPETRPLEELETVRALPDTSEMRKTNKFLIVVVYSYLMAAIITFLIIDVLFFNNLNYYTRLFIQIGLYGCLLISFLILISFDKHTTIRELGISTENLLNSILIGIFVSSGFVIVALLFWIGPIIEDFLTILTIGFLTIFIGIVEEFFFRGYIESKARKSSRKMIAILITGILFAVLHVPKYLLLPIVSRNYSYLASIPSTVQSLIILGLLFGFIRENTKNIIGPIIAHSTWDFYLLIYMPSTTYQLYSIANPGYFMIFQMVASYAMLGTFLLAWLLSSRSKVNTLEDPRELPIQIAELYSKADKYKKTISKLQNKINYLSRRQDYYKQHNYYAYRSLELKKRKIQSKIDFYKNERENILNLAENITLENYNEMMDNKDRQLIIAKNDLNLSLRNATREPISFKPERLASPRINQFGFNVMPINSKIQELERKKESIQRKIESYSLKQERIQYRNPRYVRQLEVKIEKFRCQIEYYDILIDTYKNIASTISNTNYREKRKLLNEKTRYAKRELNEKIRSINLQYYRR